MATSATVFNAHHEGQNLLFEGAGTLLDIDHGTLPVRHVQQLVVGNTVGAGVGRACCKLRWHHQGSHDAWADRSHRTADQPARYRVPLPPAQANAP